MGRRHAPSLSNQDENGSFLQYLRNVRQTRHCADFDEVITGFRWMMAALRSTIMSHLTWPSWQGHGERNAAFGPVRKKSHHEAHGPPDNIFYSGTMFGETCPSAAIATIKKMELEHVIQHLWKVGADIMLAVNSPRLPRFERCHQLYRDAPEMKINFRDHAKGHRQPDQDLVHAEHGGERSPDHRFQQCLVRHEGRRGKWIGSL
jgi:glutamate-1-semialdehyde aminotransferase